MYAFTTTKAGHCPEENEDMVCTSQFFSESGQLIRRVVVLDGKTMACNPRHFTREAAFALAGHNGLGRAAELGARAWDAYMEGRELPTHWAVPGQLARGPACTVLTATTRADGLLRVEAIGDSCLFVARRGELVNAFPLKSLDDFAPVTAELAPIRGNGKEPEPLRFRARYCSCVEVFAMTDEFARYVLRELEAGRRPFRRLRVTSNEEFLELVAEVRRSPDAVNDDMTLVWWTPSQ